MATIVNTFIEGMDKDTNPNSFKNTKYYHAENLRLLVNKDLSSGTLSNIKQLESKLKTFTGDGSGTTIVGFTYTTNYAIFFIKKVAGDDIIVAIDIDDLDGTGQDITVSENYVVKVTKAFDFSDRVEIVARQETDTLLKVYWVDGENPMRFCNLLEEGINEKPLSQFEIVQDVQFGNIIINSIIPGNLKSGTYQYAYNYYAVNGAETGYSPTTTFFPISESAVVDTRTQEFKGGISGEVTTKGLEVHLTNLDTNFDRLRIVRVYRSFQEASPEITIVYEGTFASTFSFNDTGSSILGTLIVEDLLEYPNYFKAKTLETKSNYLFPGNIEALSFDSEDLNNWDARVFRYNDAGIPECKLYNSTAVIDEGKTLTFTGTDFPPINTSARIGPVNRLQGDGTADADYKHQSDGSTVGGSGQNIKFHFTTHSYAIDDKSNPFYVNNISKLYIDDFNRVGYQRSEIYRFGIVFWDIKGRSSFVKWIGDIRMPNPDEAKVSGILHTNSDNEIKVAVLGVSFTVDTSTLPSEVKAFSIVRAPRRAVDSTVIDCGYTSALVYVSGEGTFFQYFPSMKATVEYGGSSSSINNLYEYICAETLYNKNNIVISDRLDFYAGEKNKPSFKTYHNPNHSLTTNTIGVSKLYPPKNTANKGLVGNTSCVKLSASRNLDKITRVNASNIIHRNIANTENLGPITGNTVLPNTKGSTRIGKGAKGTTLIVGTSTHYASMYTMEIGYCYRRRFIEPYGGAGDNALASTNYIICPNSSGETVFNVTGTDVVVNIYGGDTYISNCEIQRILHSNDGSEELEHFRYGNVTHAILESKINFNYISNPTWSTLDVGDYVPHRELWDQGKEYHAMWEKSGVYLAYKRDGSHYFTQDFDLYTYNPVYSPINNTRIFIPRPSDFKFESRFSNRVLNSDKKFDGEQYDFWTKFRVNNYIDVQNTFGEITKLQEHNNRLLCIQPRGIGVLSVEEREVVQSNNTSALVVGSGGVLSRVDYIATKSGSSLPNSILSTDDYFYYVDDTKKKIMQLGEGITPISDTKGISSFLKNKPLSSVSLTYNPILKEIFYDIDNERLVGNAFTNTFIGFYKEPAFKIFNYSVTSNGNTYYISNREVYTEGDTCLVPKLEILVNPSNNKVCRFDSIGVLSFSESGLPLVSLECSNEEGQETSVLTSSDFRERMRVYRCNTLRNESDGTRLISHWLKQKYEFQDTDLKVYDITTTFTPLNIQ